MYHRRWRLDEAGGWQEVVQVVELAVDQDKEWLPTLVEPRQQWQQRSNRRRRLRRPKRRYHS